MIWAWVSLEVFMVWVPFENCVVEIYSSPSRFVS